jgi:KamA family protein
MTMTQREASELRYLTIRDLEEMPELRGVSSARREAMLAVAHVLPFRVNNYVINELIDWDRVLEDPIFRLTFPQPEMLSSGQRTRVLESMGERRELRKVASEIRLELNPHPSGQLTHNVPLLNGEPVRGVQHKYAETCLVFPSFGQSCHAFCTYCFRWPQFVGARDLKFATDREMNFLDYVREHEEITDVLFTGGDPMTMRADVLARYVAPLLGPGYEHVQTIRFGTKMLSYWPYRVLTDEDSLALLGLLEQVVSAGKHLAVMAHFSHPRELETVAAQAAVGRLHDTGAVIRAQAPLIRHINDDAGLWASMWREEVALGVMPYYMFVERDTGPKEYFGVPLVEAVEIYRNAMSQVSGLARTARGPVMSAHPGKVTVDGTVEIRGRQYFSLRLLQARQPDWCGRPFLAEFDSEATWLSDLRPAFGESEFFFEAELAGLDGAAETPLAVAA